MNCEQFCFWLKGYFCGGRDNDKDVLLKDILEQFKKVKVEPLIKIINDTDELPDLD